MKKELIKISAVITAFALSMASTIPVFANTVSFSKALGRFQANVLIAEGKKDGSGSQNMKVDVRSVGNNNDGFYCVAYKNYGSSDYRATANKFCNVHKVTVVSYNKDIIFTTGVMHLYGWAQYPGLFRTSVSGKVAFH
jgi:hypothetical protein